MPALRYPIYVISKGRAGTRLTSRALEAMHMPYRIVIEPQEYDAYAAVIDAARILVLPFSNLGQGSIPARNWVWEHSIREGHARHWIVDDNIRAFYRLTQNARIRVGDGAVFCAMEDFTDRYANVAAAGPNYYFFLPDRKRCRPLILNTRVYSCILLDNALPHRWRGRYNEDTDLSLRFLRDGYCTLQFNAFLADKEQTMTTPGGNTTALYQLSNGQDGRLLMAQSLAAQHPDVVRITRKWGRWQHDVDYRQFRRNALRPRPGLVVTPGTNEYGMRLVERRPAQRSTAAAAP